MKITIDMKPNESYSVQLEIGGKIYHTYTEATSYGARSVQGTPMSSPQWDETNLCDEIVDVMERIESAAYDLMAHGDECDI